jgi:hypothetical protein
MTRSFYCPPYEQRTGVVSELWVVAGAFALDTDHVPGQARPTPLRIAGNIPAPRQIQMHDTALRTRPVRTNGVFGIRNVNRQKRDR